MYIKQGKVRFTSTDAWDMSSALRPIIYAGLLKFRECNDDLYLSSILISYCKEEGLISPHNESDFSAEDYKIINDTQKTNLDKMLYAFGEEEPNIEDYNFSLDMLQKNRNPRGEIECTLICSDEEEMTRYQTDLDLHNTKCQEGYELFGKYYTSLWW